MILCLYIEVNEQKTQKGLEWGLNHNGYAFYDATAFDPYTNHEGNKKYLTLESIEAELEMK